MPYKSPPCGHGTVWLMGKGSSGRSARLCPGHWTIGAHKSTRRPQAKLDLYRLILTPQYNCLDSARLAPVPGHHRYPRDGLLATLHDSVVDNVVYLSSFKGFQTCWCIMALLQRPLKWRRLWRYKLWQKLFSCLLMSHNKKCTTKSLFLLTPECKAVLLAPQMCMFSWVDKVAIADTTRQCLVGIKRYYA